MELVCVYDFSQVDDAERYAREHPRARIVGFEYESSQELLRRGVHVEPLPDLWPSWQGLPPNTLWRSWHDIPEMAFFTYKGMSLGEMLEVPVFLHLLTLEGYIRLFDAACRRYSGTSRLVVPRPQPVSPTAGAAGYIRSRAPERAAQWCAAQHGLDLEILGDEPVAPHTFPPVPLYRRAALGLYNGTMSLLPRKRLRLWVSDHWRNVAPMLEHLPEAELVFVERSALREVPWRQLLRRRVCIAHPLDAHTSRMRRHAADVVAAWAPQWRLAKRALGGRPECQFGGKSWWSAAEPEFEYLVMTWAVRLVADIDAAERLVESLRPDRIVLRASVSAQHHFYLMGELGLLRGVPSFELQHGAGVGIFDDMPFGYLHAQYLLSYGPLFARALERMGYAPERVLPVGSPRFSHYQAQRASMTSERRAQSLRTLGLDPARAVVFVAMPVAADMPIGSADLSGWEYQDFLRALGDIRRALPNVQWLLKFRSARQRARYESAVKELVGGPGVVCADGDAFSLMLVCDSAYSCFSTSASECLMAGLPTILFPLREDDRSFYEAHASGTVDVPLANAQGLPVAAVIEATRRLIEDREFYREMQRKGERYLADGFVTDEGAAERAAEAVRHIA